MDLRTNRARELRSRSTDAEIALWRALRARRFVGYKFRRQQPLGPFFVDFICFERRLVIEVDGAQHMARAAYDRARDAWVRRDGYGILRFADREVLTSLEGVELVIFAALQQGPLTPALARKLVGVKRA